MKIFNKENGVEKVYVQINDIMTIHYFEEGIPISAYDMAMNDDDVNIDRNVGMSFLEFSKPEEIEFFKKQDWIFDYKEYRELKISELYARIELINDELRKILNEMANIPDQEKRENNSTVLRFHLLNYKRAYIGELISYKKGKLTIPFPVVPDSDDFSLVGDTEYPYQISPSLDPNKVLLFRKDGEPLSSDEKFDRGFIQSGISIALVGRKNNDELDSEFEIVNSLSSDNKYFVIEFKNKKRKEEKKEEKGIIKLVKRFLGKKKN